MEISSLCRDSTVLTDNLCVISSGLCVSRIWISRYVLADRNYILVINFVKLWNLVFQQGGLFLKFQLRGTSFWDLVNLDALTTSSGSKAIKIL